MNEVNNFKIERPALAGLWLAIARFLQAKP
jgi:hypothetical protein